MVSDKTVKNGRHSPGRARTDLWGRTVLLVEDDFFQARDTQQALQHAGANVFGPYPDSDSALRCVANDTINCAILDVHLRDGVNFTVARALLEKGIPVILVTDQDASAIPREFADAPLVQKPVDLRSLLRLAAEVSGGGRVTPL